jgi:putative FmdB family regulatory protein
MPIYEYKCPKCGEFEVTQRITEDALKKCPTCKSKVERLLSRTSFILKGTGWYATDYASKPSGDAAKENAAKTDSAATDSSKADSAKSESSTSASAKTDSAKSDSSSTSDSSSSAAGKASAVAASAATSSGKSRKEKGGASKAAD